MISYTSSFVYKNGKPEKNVSPIQNMRNLTTRYNNCILDLRKIFRIGPQKRTSNAKVKNFKLKENKIKPNKKQLICI